MRFGHGHGRVFEGEADVEEWSLDRKRIRVIPEGWTHGIWIGVQEIIDPKDRIPAP